MGRIVLVGGGHANVQVLKVLHDQYCLQHPGEVELVLVSSGEVAYYSGMLPGAISQQYGPEEIKIELRPLAYSCGAELIVSEMTTLNPENRTLQLSNGSQLTYDYLVLDIGSRSKGTDSVPGVRQYSLMTRPLQGLMDGIKAREEQFRERGTVPAVIVVGSGVAGVELAFAFAGRWRAIYGPSVQVSLLCAGTEVTPAFPASFRSVILRNLAAKHVEVRYNSHVAEVTVAGVRLTSGLFVPADATIWATGAECQAVNVNLPVCENGFVLVTPTLQSVKYPNIFGGGDCITITGHPAGFPPKAGVYAVREGPVIASNLISLMRNQPLEAYNPQSDFLCLINTADGRGIGGKYGVVFAGPWVWQLKDYIDRSFMTKFSALTLLGAQALAVYQSGASREAVYQSCERPQEDYSQQFGCEKSQTLSEAERQAGLMTPTEAAALLLDTSDIFSSVEITDFKLNFEVIKRLSLDNPFRSAAIQSYEEEFRKRLA